jgi:hypothetical protein
VTGTGTWIGSEGGAYPRCHDVRGRATESRTAPAPPGAASASTVLKLSQSHPSEGLPTSAAELAEFYRFTDFPRFIEVYTAVNRLVRTGQDIESLVDRLAKDLAHLNVR